MPSTTLGWIWPKDPRPGNPSRWPRRWRLLDVLTNRGPDIYVGKINSHSRSRSQPQGQGQERINWSGWECRLPEGCCCTGTGLGTGVDETPFPWARRGASERYDFRRRRYVVPDHGTWCGVEYCDEEVEGVGRQRRVHVIPRRYWDWRGVEYPAGFWHDVVHGGHGHGS
ncbi:hypothetical protein CDV55_104832 [Aspergillus turcosus]|nr:hypothetical protein CDV55_104832 [Aspergillus turcosus]